MAKKSDYEILWASAREARAIKVGLCRTFFILVPLSILCACQPACKFLPSESFSRRKDLFMTMFDLAFSDAYLMFILGTVLGWFGLFLAYVISVNDKGLELFEMRSSDILADSKKKKKAANNQPKQEEDEEDEQKEEKKFSILSCINREATLYGIWTSNLMFMAFFLFFSFIMFRHFSTSW